MCVCVLLISFNSYGLILIHQVGGRGKGGWGRGEGWRRMRIFLFDYRMSPGIGDRVSGLLIKAGEFFVKDDLIACLDCGPGRPGALSHAI